MEELELNPEEEEKQSWLPLKYILGIVLGLMIIGMVIPFYAVKLDPEPKKIPTLNEIVPAGLEAGNYTRIYSANEYYKLMNPNDPEIKRIADKIASYSCDSNKICQAKTLYYFTRNNIIYVSDPPYEYVKSAKETLVSKGGDCDDHAVLLANLMQAIGIRTEYVFVPNHVFIKIYLPEALKKYKSGGTNWINLDPTCSDCKFGEIAPEYLKYI
jgi:transglutaminase-like putative cysteine protease